MKKQIFDKIFQRHSLVKALGIASLALILLVDIVGASPFAYVGYDVRNGNDYGAVSIIDIATKKVTATVPVELDIGGVTATPNGNKLYVTSPTTNVVSVIDTKTKKVTAKIDVGWRPYGVAVTPDGKKVYVANRDDGTISVIDTATNNVIATVDVGSSPKAVTVNPAGTVLYVANTDDNTISVIDTATNSVTATVPVGHNPSGIAVTQDGTKVYVSNENSVFYDMNTVSEIDATSNTVVQTFYLPGQALGASANPKGRWLYVPYSDIDINGIAVYDTNKDSFYNVLWPGNVAGYIATIPDGKEIYVTMPNSNSVNIIDTMTGRTKASIGIGNGNSIAFDCITIGPAATPVPSVANFSSNVTSGYAPLSVQFTDKSTGSPTAWKWTFGDGQSSVVKNPVHIYDKTGNYTVSLNVTNKDGTNTKIINNYIAVKSSSMKPVANFSASPTSGKAPLTVQFTDKSTGSPTSWNWNFGDGMYSTQKNPAYTYSKVGNYTVSLTVKNAAGTNTKTIKNCIIVKTAPTKPVAAFSATPTSGKAPLKVQFTDKSTGSPTSWKWSFGDGKTSTAKSPAYTYSKAGKYTVSLTVKNTAGSNTKTMSGYIAVAK